MKVDEKTKKWKKMNSLESQIKKVFVYLKKIMVKTASDMKFLIKESDMK